MGICILGFNGRTHNHVKFSLGPFHTTFSLWYTITFFPYVTKHPASINIFTDTSDVCASPGTMCAFLTALGKFGLLISHSCVDTSFFPSGWLMLIGFLAHLMLIASAPGWRKCPVAPASAIPIFFPILMGLVAL